MGMRPTRRRQDDQRSADRIAAALALIRQSDERWHGLAVEGRHGSGLRSARPAGSEGAAGTLSGGSDSQ